LLFTRMDETETFGPILSRSVRMGRPVSFFSRGQRIPEDLEPATADLLLDLVLGRWPVGAVKFGVVAA
jgi:flagellar biosynthesis protein FlhF